MLQYQFKHNQLNKVCRANSISAICYVLRASETQVLDLLAGNIAELNGWANYGNKANTKLQQNNRCNKLYRFVHESGIERICTQSALSQEFSLAQSILSLVVNGKRAKHKGWRLGA